MFKSELTTIKKNALNLSSIETLMIPSKVVNFDYNWCINTPKLNTIIISKNNMYFIYYNNSLLIL